MRNVPFRRGGLLAALLISVVASAPLAAQDSTQSQPAPGGTHTVKKGDTLWDIAKQYLNDAFLWPEIYRINTDVVEDPHWIYPNEVLKLPGNATVATTGSEVTTVVDDRMSPMPNRWSCCIARRAAMACGCASDSIISSCRKCWAPAG